MKIELVQGCIADRFDIDGKPACDMSVEELKTAFSKVCEYIMQLPQEQTYNLQNALYSLVETFTPCEHSEDSCECCGDFIETYTLEISPIPITEEWLAKNDFKEEYSHIVNYHSHKRKIGGYYVDIQFCCSNMGDDYVNCHIDNCDRCTVASADIQYVHQLQNLLNIMNIKFDIKL